MRFIAHRANLSGPDKNKENNPKQVEYIFGRHPQINIELDLWKIGKSFYLGHDKPKFKLSDETMSYFSQDNRIWFHCKNIDAFDYLHREFFDNDLYCNYFWHNEDDFAITVPGNFIWTFPGKQLTKYSICVLPEKVSNYTDKDFKRGKGICTDYVFKYMELLKKS